MAADELHVVAQRQQFLMDRSDQRGVVAIGEIGAANAAAKQHIAHNGQPHCLADKNHMARRVPGAMQHGETLGADLHHLTLLQPAVGHQVARWRQAIGGGLLGEIVEQHLIGQMRPFHRRPGHLAQFIRATGMVHMAMGDQDTLEGDALLLQHIEDTRHIAAGVHHHPLHGRVIPEQ